MKTTAHSKGDYMVGRGRTRVSQEAGRRMQARAFIVVSVGRKR